MIACTCVVPTPAKPWSGTMVWTPSEPCATTSMFLFIARCQGGDFQDHGSDGVLTMVQDHGFARVGTMQVQAIMPPSIAKGFKNDALATSPLSSIDPTFATSDLCN